jgi:hypothetical protein
MMMWGALPNMRRTWRAGITQKPYHLSSEAHRLRLPFHLNKETR